MKGNTTSLLSNFTFIYRNFNSLFSFEPILLKDCLNRFKIASEKQDDRITQLELQNKGQHEEMKFFKRKMSEYGIEIDQTKDEK